MKRGEIWWADLPPPAGTRPVILLSRDSAYPVRGFVIVSPLTSHARGLQTEVTLGVSDGMPRPCVINLDTLRTIPKTTLQRRITQLSPVKMLAVEAAIRHALDLSP